MRVGVGERRRRRRRGEGVEDCHWATVAGQGGQVGEGDSIEDEDLPRTQSNQQLYCVAVEGGDLALCEGEMRKEVKEVKVVER